MPDFYDILWYFILYSFIGWLVEVVFCSVDTGKFVNRGFLNGPVCPIYGAGAVILILCLGMVPAQNLLLLFAASALLASGLELVVGYVLKKLFHTSWWDYSDQPFNLGGYICLKFSLAWGLAGVLLMRVLQPGIAGLVEMIPLILGRILLVFFYILLLADTIVTVSVIAKLNRDLGEITRIAKGLHKGSDALAENLGNTAIKAADKIKDMDIEGQIEGQKEKLTTRMDEGKEKWMELWCEGLGKLDEIKLQSKEKWDELKKIRALQDTHRFFRRRIFGAFPNMKNTDYTRALEQMRARYARKDKDTTENDDE